MTGYNRFKNHPVLIFAVIYLLLDFLAVVLFFFDVFSLFRAILFIYISNLVVLPAIGVIYFFANVLRKRHNRANLAVSAISILLLCTFIYATFIEPRNLEVIEIEIITDKIDGEVVIAHISDIQSKKIGAYEEKVFDTLAELKPDVVFHTGDLIQPLSAEQLSAGLGMLAELFSRLEPRYGVYNVLGNIDYEPMTGAFDKQAGIKTLVDESIVIRGEGFELDILGLSWKQSIEGDKRTIDRWLGKDNGSFTIILGHAPDYVMSILDSEVDLCVAGHTHGGQVNLPFIGALLNASETPKAWAKGFRKLDHTNLNVSSGIGTERASDLVPIRFNCRPTITVFKITGNTVNP